MGCNFWNRDPNLPQPEVNGTVRIFTVKRGSVLGPGG